AAKTDHLIGYRRFVASGILPVSRRGKGEKKEGLRPTEESSGPPKKDPSHVQLSARPAEGPNLCQDPPTKTKSQVCSSIGVTGKPASAFRLRPHRPSRLRAWVHCHFHWQRLRPGNHGAIPGGQDERDPQRRRKHLVGHRRQRCRSGYTG